MATASRRLPDWEVGEFRYPLVRKISMVVAVLGPLLLFVGAWMILEGPARAGASVITLGWVTFLLVNQWRAIQGSVVPDRTVAPLDDARFENIVRGLASQHGLGVPELSVIEGGGPNALITRRVKARLVVTRSLLETFTRTEQEAVAAHCLLRLASGQVTFVHLASSLGRAGSRFAPRVGFEDDIHTAALTRYPPALAAAIEKANPVEGPSGPFWFVANDPSHRHPSERIAALQDL